MIVAIMQPYFFPYVGYFQLMHAVDVFVMYDDVQFIKGGWINRNRILVEGKPSWLTLPVKHDRVTSAINERIYVLGNSIENAREKLTSAYSKSPAFSEAFPFLASLLDFAEPNVALFNGNLLRRIAQRLDIACEIVASSKLDPTHELHGEARVIRLCKALGATQYINAIGGVDLYDSRHFADSGLRLSFLGTTCQPTHFQNGQAHLSIIHTLMHGGTEAGRGQLNRYELLDSEHATAPAIPSSTHDDS